jgi:hypothetical protein
MFATCFSSIGASADPEVGLWDRNDRYREKSRLPGLKPSRTGSKWSSAGQGTGLVDINPAGAITRAHIDKDNVIHGFLRLAMP